MNASAVSTFLLQPLVENAIHHGTSKLSARGILELSAWRSGESLHVRVRQTAPVCRRGGPSSARPALDFETRARASNICSAQDNYSLDVTRDDERGTCVDVIFPYRVA